MDDGVKSNTYVGMNEMIQLQVVTLLLIVVSCAGSDVRAQTYRAYGPSSAVSANTENPVRLLAPEHRSAVDPLIQLTNLQVPPIPPSTPFIEAPIAPRNQEAINPPDLRDAINNGQPPNPFLTAQGDRPFFERLSRSPDVFGDSLIVINTQFSTFNNDPSIDADIVLGGGARRFKNEQAKAFPTDRAFIYYQHFHNALEFRVDTGASADRSVDRLTLGFEKTFNEGRSSWEVRMPFSGNQGVALQGFNYSSGGVGNLIVSLKHLLYAEENIAIALGLATSTPTGSNLSGAVGTTTFQIKNRAVHLLPYLGLQLTPDERWFFHAYVQVDTPVGSNTITQQAFQGQLSESVGYKDEPLLYLDAAAGYWWFKDDSADAFLTGVASMIELHYTSSLQEADTLEPLNSLAVSRRGNRINHLNLTAGLHSEFSRSWAFRSAIVVPLRSGEDRVFDTEIQIALVKMLGR